MCRIELVSNNLEFIKSLIEEGVKIDLIYIDPPFNTGRDFGAFTDKWGNAYNEAEVAEFKLILPKLSIVLGSLELRKDYYNYLVSMSLRIFYLHKLLSEKGSFYLHCDSVANSHLKIICDSVFGVNNFRNVITWQRTKGGKSNSTKNYPRNSDFIFFYTKTDNYTFNPCYKELSEGGLSPYRYKDEKGRLYCLINVSAPSSKNGVREWNIDGKIIKYDNPSRNLAWTQKTLDKKRKEHFEKYGTELIQISKNGVARYVKYKEDSKGVCIDNIWTDINCVQSSAKELLGYPTQKPEKLLERIILASSNEGDLVGDFYLGSGTTAAVAIKNNRDFIGCDMNPRAIEISTQRVKSLKNLFNESEL